METIAARVNAATVIEQSKAGKRGKRWKYLLGE
jgi:hypothetical protein